MKTGGIHHKASLLLPQQKWSQLQQIINPITTACILLLSPIRKGNYLFAQ